MRRPLRRRRFGFLYAGSWRRQGHPLDRPCTVGMRIYRRIDFLLLSSSFSSSFSSPSPFPSPLPHSLLLPLFFLSRPSLFSLPTSFYSLCSSSFPHFLSFPSPLPSPLFQFSPTPPVRKQKSRKKKKINSLFQASSSRRFPDDEPQSRGDGSKRVNTCAINALTRATCWQTT